MPYKALGTVFVLPAFAHQFQVLERLTDSNKLSQEDRDILTLTKEVFQDATAAAKYIAKVRDMFKRQPVQDLRTSRVLDSVYRMMTDRDTLAVRFVATKAARSWGTIQ